ncbi:hypothetical protein HE1_01090 [Holospora elegans E1]|uniref:Uncharacterized protein n=1 Tax=Holospora elegans E1 TaxID=1427503 RepID=A0A023DYZ9_9PROT|nr:hypothetical protein [Holospora elegans]GAJ46751.1 hypothetical protein HE1_01090 [Holospora elegans E1]
MNVRRALKSVLFEGFRGENVKNVEKFSRGVPEKDKLQALVLYASGLYDEPNYSAFLYQRHRCFEGGRTLGSRLCAKVELPPEDKGIVMEVDKFLYI